MADNRSRRIEVLKMIASDAEADAKRFDGLPFNGRTVAEYFGNHGAAIATLADILREEIEAAQLDVHPTEKDDG
jgi:hypothetical protein